jgi:1-pyrroline-4-hydroxy-2-carboxylate deaminase
MQGIDTVTDQGMRHMAKAATPAKAQKWSGIFPAVTTKFDEQDGLDHAEMERCYKLQFDAGVDGMIVCGSLGEASTLDANEKIDILKTAKRVAGSKPVILTIADGSTRTACQMAEAGAKAGAAGFMVLPGLPYKSDRRETVRHFTEVARAGGLPVMIYNNPPAYGVDVTPDMLADMASEPLFTSVKESSDNVRRVTDIINKTGSRYQIFTGVDNLALESFAMGAVGWVAGLVAAFPAETVAIWKLQQAGRHAEALDIYRWFRPLLDLDVSTKLVQNIKLVEALVIETNDRCRAPRLALTGRERSHVISVVDGALRRRPKVPKLNAAKKSG